MEIRSLNQWIVRTVLKQMAGRVYTFWVERTDLLGTQAQTT